MPPSSPTTHNSSLPAAPFFTNVLWPPGSEPPPLDSLLPGVFREDGFCRLSAPSLSSPAYLTAELGLGRLEGFSHYWRWLLGAPALPRPLHDSCHRGRIICITERMDRHLGLGPAPGGGGGSSNNLLYLKPLPRFLLDTRSWEEFLSCGCLRDAAPQYETAGTAAGNGVLIGIASGSGSGSSPEKLPRDSIGAVSEKLPRNSISSDPVSEKQPRDSIGSGTGTITSTIAGPEKPPRGGGSMHSTMASHATTTRSSSSSGCNKRHLWECALGLLYSYAALVAHESDFRIAQQHGLLPPEVTWAGWRQVTRELATAPDIVHRRFHQRFRHGELRLNRLREISQLRRGGLLPVLAARLDRFARFFQQNVRWLASLTAYLAIVLSALQTGLTGDTLSASRAFQTFATGFTVFSLVAPLSILAAFGLYFGLSLVYHVIVHLITDHLLVGAEGQAILQEADVFHHWDSKSDV